jgi:3-isopropylmalate/(R)-2-methylmalate dehydratase small subunit
MKKFVSVSAIAAPMDTVNLDTDQLIPARFIRKPRDHEDYHLYLFHDLRYNESGAERPEFVLNQAPYRAARIIVGARNFGCGSSREAAVFALDANDFRAVVAPSYGDIFFNNCFKDGILPVMLDEVVVDGLRAALYAEPGASLSIDLETQILIGPDGTRHPFDVDPFRKHCLLNGLDDIQLTLQHEAEMEAFEVAYRDEMSWLYR